MRPSATLGRYVNAGWYVNVHGKGDIARTTDARSAIAAMRLLCGQAAVDEFRAYMRDLVPRTHWKGHEVVAALNAEGGAR